MKTTLHQASQEGNLNAVKEILESGKEYINCDDIQIRKLVMRLKFTYFKIFQFSIFYWIEYQY